MNKGCRAYGRKGPGSVWQEERIMFHLAPLSCSRTQRLLLSIALRTVCVTGMAGTPGGITGKSGEEEQVGQFRTESQRSQKSRESCVHCTLSVLGKIIIEGPDSCGARQDQFRRKQRRQCKRALSYHPSYTPNTLTGRRR